MGWHFPLDEKDLRVRDLVKLFERMEHIILDYVNLSAGIKDVDLVLKVMGEVSPVRFTAKEFEEIIESLVSSGQIVAMEYKVPHMRDKLKTIYFPKGTLFNDQNPKTT